MATGDPTTVNNSNLMVGGVSGLSAAAIALAVFGTFFHAGNEVSVQHYTTAHLLNGTLPYEVVSSTGSTATGGLASASGNYEAIHMKSPLNSTDATSNGLSTESGAISYFQVTITNAELANTVTCSVNTNATRGTGGTIIVSRTTIGTGTTVIRSTGATLIAAHEAVHCSLGKAPSAGFSANALLKMVPFQ